VAWLTGPVGRELAELAGPLETSATSFATPGELTTTTPGPASPAGGPSLDAAERRLLRLLTEGRTNAEIAAELDLGEEVVAQRLARLQARLGTSSRAEATSLAFRGLAAVGSS
jgi:DNA-binding CsgD family transcriptional regulator